MIKESAKIDKYTLGERAAQIIRERIIKGEYPYGTKLIEEGLASDFNISRLCIRDAFSILEAEGILKRERNKSTKVLEFEEKRIQDLFWFRQGIEAICIENCIVTNKKIDSIKESLKSLVSVTEKGNIEIIDYVESDLDFHGSIISASENSYAINVWKTIKTLLMTLLYSIYRDYSNFEITGMEQHKDIFTAIGQKDKARAIEISRNHIQENLTIIQNLKMKR